MVLHVDELLSILQLQVPWRIDEAECSIHDEPDPVTELVCDEHVVRRKEDRCPLLVLLLDDVLDLVRNGRVQPCCRLIEEPDGRLVDHAPCEGQPVLHPFGEGICTFSSHMVQSDKFQKIHRIERLSIEEFTVEFQILQRSQLSIDIGLLKGDADTIEHLPRSLPQVVSSDLSFTLLDREQSGEDALRRRFPCSGWTKESEDLSFGHLETHIIDREFAIFLIGIFQVFNFDHYCSHSFLLSRIE